MPSPAAVTSNVPSGENATDRVDWECPAINLHRACAGCVPDPDRFLVRAGGCHEATIRRVCDGLRRGRRLMWRVRLPCGELPDDDSRIGDRSRSRGQ